MNFTKILNADWTLSYDEQGREKPGLPKKYGSELLLAYYRYLMANMFFFHQYVFNTNNLH